MYRERDVNSDGEIRLRGRGGDLGEQKSIKSSPGINDRSSLRVHNIGIYNKQTRQKLWGLFVVYNIYV